jgi:MFS family permease
MLKPYQWFVFIVCCLAWDLDCLDQQLFVLARNPALTTLMGGASADVKEVNKYGGYATAVFMIGWAIGGIGFGILGDRLGRVKTLTMTIGLYALFTGLSAFSTSQWDFMAYRLLTGLGVGGAFAAAVVLLAESVPDAPRPYLLGLFQASSVIGNCSAALISMYLGKLQGEGFFKDYLWLTPWRVMFLIGILPGLLLVVVQFSLREPEKWLKMREEELKGAKPAPWSAFFGTLIAMLSTAPWSRRAVFGLLLTSAGVIGLWGIGFFAPELTTTALTKTLEAEGLTGDQLKGDLNYWRGKISARS